MAKLETLVGPSYTLRSVAYEAQRALNMFVETNEVGVAKEREPALLVSVPGQDKIIVMPNSPIRGIHRTTYGHIIVVAGSTIYYLSSPDRGITWNEPEPIAALTTSTGPVSIADGISNAYNGNPNTGNISLVVVVDGSNYGIVFEEGTTTAIQLNNGNQFNGASFVAFQQGFFIFTQNINSATCFFSNDPLNISELDIFVVNHGADYITRVISDHDILWVFGARSSTVWQNTGGSGIASNVYEVIPGSYAEGGCNYPHTIAKASGQMLWVNSDERGYGQVFMAAGYRGARVSNHAVEQWLQSFPTLEGATAWTYQDIGHTFYCLNVPGSIVTWAYDIIEKEWSERGFHKQGVFSRDLIEHHVMLGSEFRNIHLCGDYNNGNLYKLSNDSYTLNGEPIYRLRTTPHTSSAFKRLFISQVQIDVESGIGLGGTGYNYFVGYDTTAAPILSHAVSVPMSGSSSDFTFVNSDRIPVIPINTPTITSSGTWSNTYTITGSTLHALPIDFTIPVTQYGIGNGSLSNYTFSTGGLATGTTINSATFYTSDWRGNIVQTTTPITNLCTSSEDFNATATWTSRGLKSILPATWGTNYSVNDRYFRPTNYSYSIIANQYIDHPEYPLTKTSSALENEDSIFYTKIHATTSGSIHIIYKDFGNGLNIKGILNISLNHYSLAENNSSCYVEYSLDGGLTFIQPVEPIPRWFSPSGAVYSPTATFSIATPLQLELTVPDLSKLQIKYSYGPGDSLTGVIKIYDMVFITADTTVATIPQNAPDGINSGTYITEDPTYNQHALECSYAAISGDTTTVSTYFQPGSKLRSLELVAINKPLSFTGRVDGNQLYILTPPVDGTLKIGQTIESTQTLPGTTITAGTSSPYTLSWTNPNSNSFLLYEAMTAYEYIGKGSFWSNGNPTSEIGVANSSNVATVCMGSITGNQLEVNTLYSGTLAVGMIISGDHIPGGVTITSGVVSPYTLSNTFSTPITSEIMSVSSGALDTGIYRCSLVFTETESSTHYAGIRFYNPYCNHKTTYTGNNASTIGVWGYQVQKGALTQYIKSASGVAGVDYVTPNLTTGTVIYKVPPYSGALLTWSGSVNGVSISPITLNATFDYEYYPSIFENIGVDPQISLSYSDDGGRTFGPERSVSIGRQGDYTKRCIWRRCGMSRNRVWRITCGEPIKFNILGGEFTGTTSELGY